MIEFLGFLFEVLIRWITFGYRVYRLVRESQDGDAKDVLREGFLLVFLAMVFWSQTGTIMFPAR